MAPDIHVFTDAERLAEGAARRIVSILDMVLDARPRASFVLTGGSTPADTYRHLADRLHDAIDWKRVDLFWGDERFVPHDHEDSNYRMAAETLLEGIRPAGVFPIPTKHESPGAAAEAYERILHDYFGSEEPAFDLTLLGMGADGHVASLFPGAPELEERQRLVVASTAPDYLAVRDRISLTFRALNASRSVLFLVSGTKKRDAVRKALNRDPSIPAGRIQPTERLAWYVDVAASP